MEAMEELKINIEENINWEVELLPDGKSHIVCYCGGSNKFEVLSVCEHYGYVEFFAAPCE